MPHRARILRHVILITLALITLSGCQRASRQGDQAPEVNVTLEIAPQPPVQGPTHLIIRLTDGKGLPVEGATLRIKGDMSHAGMVPVRAEASGGTGGVYEADFEWTMGGDWFVTVLATLPDGRLTSRRFDLTVLGEMP
ncbi:MAG: FixH family protein [Chloroflexota bacterium]|nr:FixH family protein [Chloroflexota bacterium]